MYSNQKIIRVIKGAADKNHIYGIFNKEAMYLAMQRLSPSGFKLWCYLNCNQNERQFGLSLVDVQNCCRLGRATYYRAVDELIEKRYLIAVELTDKISGYLFLETGSTD